jgi:hypothetical protein
MIRLFLFSLATLIFNGTAAAQTLPPPQVLRVDSGRADAGFAIAGDTAGNVLVAGSVEDPGRATRFAVVKYDARGRLVWRSHHGGAVGGPVGDARSVAADSAGNVYATGRVLTTTGITTVVRGVLMRLDPNGRELWSRDLGLGNVGVNVSTDVQGDAVVSTISGATARFDAAGTLRWQRTYQGAAAGDSLAVTDQALDADGNAVVTGFALNASGLRGATDIATLKYDRQGELLWQQVYTETAASDEKAWDLALGVDGRVIVTGSTTPDTSGELMVTPLLLTYDANGTPLQVRAAPELGGLATTVDAAGDIYVAGFGQVSRLDPAGNTRWSVAFPPAVNEANLALGAGGEIYASAGLSTLRLGADGGAEGSFTFTDGSRNRLTTSALHVDSAGVLHAVGTSSTALSTSADMITLRFGGVGTPPTPMPTPPPGAPSSLRAVVSGSQVALGWRDNANDESGFRVERCAGNNCSNFQAIAQTAANAVSFVDSGVAAGRYRYRVRAFNTAGTSAASNIVAVRVR